MHILFTLHDDFDANAGGMGVTAALGDAYVRRGNTVEYLTFADLPGALPFRAKFMVFPELAALRLGRFSADVIDASCGDTWIWARLPWRRGQVDRPLLVTRSHGLLHIADRARRAEAERGGIDLSWKYPLYWGGYRLREVAASYRSADLCLFLNEEEREYGLERFGLTEESARVVDNGLPEFLLGREPEPLDGSAGSFGIAHVGSYLALKGVRYTAAAVSAILERHPGAHASFLGTACPVERVLDDYDSHLHDRIRVVPRYRREELPELLRGHSATVSSTLQDAFHLGTLEAMACGLAPVVAATAGPLQYVRDGENGIVVPQADAAAMERALEGLIGDPAQLERLRAAANRTAQRYSWERIADDTLGLYAEALERLGRPATAYSP